ncbi:MAG: C-type lectin domain-containing protein [Clostridia bacterium]|nr:C-type lectin domain-containing protein [Clostridia bacterium]
MKKNFVKIVSAFLSLLLILSALTQSVTAEDLLSKGERMTYNGHTYIRVDSSMTWKEAKAYCESNGGYLATVTRLAENTAAEGLIETEKKNSIGSVPLMSKMKACGNGLQVKNGLILFPVHILTMPTALSIICKYTV